MMNYKDMNCDDYVPLCVLEEIKKLQQDIAALKKEVARLSAEKVSVTHITPAMTQKEIKEK